MTAPRTIAPTVPLRGRRLLAGSFTAATAVAALIGIGIGTGAVPVYPFAATCVLLAVLSNRLGTVTGMNDRSRELDEYEHAQRSRRREQALWILSACAGVCALVIGVSAESGSVDLIRATTAFLLLAVLFALTWPNLVTAWTTPDGEDM
ncbi:hypothetical protein JIM95_007525 [Corynebacterium sp. CCM 8835]|uniref:Uncharacterized protein n=1 Tax=Corynebacterium antarcticum TaxID=2800405 RepID=A0ABS1FMQ8_9CORY|nr:hypothetical protein [Corynebacterium antarcticum]MCK7642749.1 hypothetical protein [Corynebacterium antarcticum]MCK7661235.1 hypothetical protein [Corynebacterium antarcticum]MCL0245988.1 hypothetical protein [Corynebacterium antarcticum]MCX7492236.1 hypothetical protein [Corynebacterium antarcticum]